MPRIKATNLEEHHEIVWQDITDALRSLLAERDYENITLGQIAQRAGIARNSLYRYAPDKTALLLAVAHRAGGPAIARIQAVAASSAPAIERVRGIVEELIGTLSSDAMRFLLQPALTSMVPLDTLRVEGRPFHEIARAMEDVVRDGVAEGVFRLAADEHLTSWLLSGVIRSAAETIMRRERTSDEVMPVVQELIVNALAPGTDNR